MSSLTGDIEEFMSLHERHKAGTLAPELEARYRTLRSRVQHGLQAPDAVAPAAAPARASVSAWPSPASAVRTR